MAIRTLTEFSGTLIRMAAKAEAEAKKSLPKELSQVVPASAPADVEVTAQPTQHAQAAGEVPHREPDVEGGPGEASEAQAFSSATDATDELAAKESAAEDASAAAKIEAKAEVVEAGETDAVKAILDEAVSKATSTTGDRLARLREATHAAGRNAERVRLVRVFGGEDVVAGAKKIGEHQFLVDLMPASMKQVFKDPKEEKGARRGPQRPSGSTKNKNDASLEGSFSMDTVAQDRKSERGAGGPGRKPGGPGGARPAGGRGGRPGGGAPRGAGGGRPGSPKP